MKNQKFLHASLTVIFCTLIIAMGWVYLVNGTTIGANISTVDLTVTGLATLDALKFTGASTTLAATLKTVSNQMTAAQACDNTYITISPRDAGVNVYLPTAASLVADCLTSNGAYKDIWYINSADAASSTYVVASTGITIQYPTSTNASTTINGGAEALIRLVRTSGAAVDAIINFYW